MSDKSHCSQDENYENISLLFSKGITAFRSYSLLIYVRNKHLTGKGNGKAVLLQAWNGPEGSRNLSFPDFMTTAQDGGKVVSLTHRPPLPAGNIPGTHFC